MYTRSFSKIKVFFFLLLILKLTTTVVGDEYTYARTRLGNIYRKIIIETRGNNGVLNRIKNPHPYSPVRLRK